MNPIKACTANNEMWAHMIGASRWSLINTCMSLLINSSKRKTLSLLCLPGARCQHAASVRKAGATFATTAHNPSSGALTYRRSATQRCIQLAPVSQQLYMALYNRPDTSQDVLLGQKRRKPVQVQQQHCATITLQLPPPIAHFIMLPDLKNDTKHAQAMWDSHCLSDLFVCLLISTSSACCLAAPRHTMFSAQAYIV